jgi:uncharacterized glyoxalase superfamily protein PhnB
MRTVSYSGLAVLALAFTSATATPGTSDETMKRLTPVIFVEEVEPCIAFWIDRLGFEKTAEVREGDRIGFAAVSAGNVEVMYQSRASIANDIPTFAEGPFHKSGALFVEVSDLDAIKVKLDGADLILPERTTFYGAREIAVRAPCGTAVIFAEMDQG